MKILTYLLAIAIILSLAVFDIKNYVVLIDFYTVLGTLKNMSLSIVVSVAFLSGLIVGTLYHVAFIIDNKKSVNAHSKRVEKMSIDKDSAEMKLKTLEAKVKTLEIALEKALSNKM